MAKAAPAEGDAPPKKSKKMLFIIVGVVLVLLIGGGAAAFLLMSGGNADEEGGDGGHAKVEKHDPKHPPEYLALENLVVNLTDAGGANRYAQLGISVQVKDAATAELIKKYMPAIRNGLIMTVSSQTAEVLLTQEGKDNLAKTLLTLIQEASGLVAHGKTESPVQAVLFSSFIVQ